MKVIRDSDKSRPSLWPRIRGSFRSSWFNLFRRGTKIAQEMIDVLTTRDWDMEACESDLSHFFVEVR